MKHTKIAHFWNWLERHHETYQFFNVLTRIERQYWMAELEGHLTAYHRFLRPHFISFDSYRGSCCQLIISADGRAKSFGMADRLIGRAPELAAWEFVSLVPPAPFGFIAEGLDQLYAAVGKVWFDARLAAYQAKRPFILFVEDRAQCSYREEDLMDNVIYRILGERSYSLCVDYLRVEGRNSLSPDDHVFLRPLSLLGNYIDTSGMSGMVVRKDGRIGRR